MREEFFGDITIYGYAYLSIYQGELTLDSSDITDWDVETAYGSKVEISGSDCAEAWDDNLVLQEVRKSLESEGIELTKDTYAEVEASITIEAEYSGYFSSGYFNGYDDFASEEGELTVDGGPGSVYADIEQYIPLTEADFH